MKFHKAARKQIAKSSSRKQGRKGVWTKRGTRGTKPKQKKIIEKIEFVIERNGAVEYRCFYFANGEKEVNIDKYGYLQMIEDLMKNGYLYIKKEKKNIKGSHCPRVVSSSVNISFDTLDSVARFLRQKGMDVKQRAIYAPTRQEQKLQTVAFA